MQGFFREHLRPLAGSAGLHLLIVGVLAAAALRWTSSQPPAEPAIEGYVVELPPDTKAGAPPRSVAPAPSPRPAEPAPAPVPEVAEPEPAPTPEPSRDEGAEQARAERERAAEARRAEEQAAREEAVAERRARDKAAAEKAAAQKAAAEKAAQEKAAAEAERKRAAAAEAKRKADDEAKAEREAALQRSLADEEEGVALARSGVMDEYRTLLAQAIERSWIRPPSARAGLECTLYVTQAPGGTVLDVKLGACNGDQAVRESITNAVFRASPLPPPRDARLFERRLEIVFRPTE